MPNSGPNLFTTQFCDTLQELVTVHHSLYPRIPPQGIFFESLVEQAFLRSGWARHAVILTTRNSPQHDLTVGTARLSLKTETGLGTRAGLISITKLCTTETGEWISNALIEHAMRHLERYDRMLMLRAVWRGDQLIHYQLLEIPVDVLKLMKAAEAVPVGRRQGRRSLAVDIERAGETLFRVHFDGADGKCQIHRLRIEHCQMLREWDQLLPA